VPGRVAADARRTAPIREGPAPKAPADAPDEATALVIADAIRLRGWGKAWHELAEAITRMAGRPSIAEVRKILRTHKAEIEAAPAPRGSDRPPRS